MQRQQEKQHQTMQRQQEKQQQTMQQERQQTEQEKQQQTMQQERQQTEQEKQQQTMQRQERQQTEQEKQQQTMQRQERRQQTEQEKQQQTMQRQEDVEKVMKGRKRNLEDDVEKLMKLRKRNRETARRAREKKENHIRSLESESRKNAYLISALKTDIQHLESKIRSQNAIIQILKQQEQQQEQEEQTGFDVKIPTDDYNLRRQFLFDVCQATDIPQELLDPLVREYNNGGGPVDVPMISDFLLKPWNYEDQLEF